MSDLYDGPVVLRDANGTEIPLHGRLGWYAPGSIPGIEPPIDYEPRERTWGGVLTAEGPLASVPLPTPGMVRLPSGRELVYDEMSGDSAAPHRVEVNGTGTAPWDLS